MLPCAVGFNQSMQPYECNVTLAREYMEKAGFELTEIEPTTTAPFLILVTMITGLTAIGYFRKRKKKIK